MDCRTAQEFISAGVDRECVDAEELAAAKAHCAGCEECAAFVRTLVAMRRVPPPEPPEGLADRAVARVRAEAAADAARLAAVGVANRTAPDAEAVKPTAIPLDDETRARLSRRRLSRGQWIAVGSAAAVVLFAAGFAALAGVRAIVAPTREAATDMSYDGVMSAEQDAKGGAVAESTGASAASATAGARFLATGSVPEYIAVGEDVYINAGPVAYPVASLSRIGSTVSALQSGETTERAVYRQPDGESVAVEADTGDLLGFTRVVRTYAGRTYALKAQPIGAFGVWPMLPTRVPAPQSNDGSPTFEELEADLTGARIYVRVGQPATTGIAIAPDSPVDDPARGNPNLTWWEPIR